MEFKHKNHSEAGEINAFENENPVGRLTYYLKNDGTTMAIDKVVVLAEMQEQGIGSKLMEEAIALAKKADQKIFPECAFAKYYFEENPELKQLTDK